MWNQRYLCRKGGVSCGPGLSISTLKWWPQNELLEYFCWAAGKVFFKMGTSSRAFTDSEKGKIPWIRPQESVLPKWAIWEKCGIFFWEKCEICLCRPLKKYQVSALLPSPFEMVEGPLCHSHGKTLRRRWLNRFWFCSGSVFQILIQEEGLFLDLKGKYSLQSLNLLLTSGKKRPAGEVEESTSSEHLSHVQWDPNWKACVMLGIESWHLRSCWANPPNAQRGCISY